MNNWNTINFDRNNDFSGASVPITNPVVHVAGYYRVRCSVVFGGLTSSHTYLLLKLIHFDGVSQRTYQYREPINNPPNGYQSVYLENSFSCHYSDYFEVQYAIFGASTSTASAFADAGSNFCCFSGELL
jgi:hypothetical protein